MTHPVRKDGLLILVEECAEISRTVCGVFKCSGDGYRFPTLVLFEFRVKLLADEVERIGAEYR